MSEAPVGAVEGRAPVEWRPVTVLESHTLADCADPAACWWPPHRTADQSQPLPPRDGLAGSDEVKRAPNRVRPSQVIIVGARMTEDVLDLVRDVEDGFAEAVRAEAVAEERQRMRSNETVGAVAKYLNAALLSGRSITAGQAARDIAEIVAAGSVPVATPEIPDSRIGNREWSLTHAVRSSMWPNITWYPDNTSGPEWEQASAVADRLRDWLPDVGWKPIAEFERLTADVARLRLERNQALQREVEAACRCVDLTAEVLRYRAAIEKVEAGFSQLRERAGRVLGGVLTYHDGIEQACQMVEAVLAAALGDGE